MEKEQWKTPMFFYVKNSHVLCRDEKEQYEGFIL
jgi:hypothetical protein